MPIGAVAKPAQIGGESEVALQPQRHEDADAEERGVGHHQRRRARS